MSKSRPKRRIAKRFGYFLVVIVVGYLLMGFLYRLPDISDRSRSYAIDGGVVTSLGRDFNNELAANPGKTGI